MRIALIIVILLLLCAERGITETPQPKINGQETAENNGTKNPQNKTRQSFAALTGRQPHPQNPTNSSNNKTIEERNIIIQERIAGYTRWLAALAGFQFITMFVQSIFLRKTLSATETAANAAKTTTDIAFRARIETQRPFIFIHDIHTSANFQPGEEITSGYMITARVENTGQTPAVNCKLRTRLESSVAGQVPAFEIDEYNEYGVPIGPKATGSGVNVFVPLTDLMRVINKEISIYFWAHIEYEDMFNTGTIYHSQICGVIEVLVDPTSLRWVDRSQPVKLPTFATVKLVGPQNSAT